jgi:hypothetical protein
MCGAKGGRCRTLIGDTMASFFFIDDHPSRAGRKGTKALLSSVPKAADLPSNDPAHGTWAQSSTLRKEVQPPTLFSKSEPQWRRWMTSAWHWLWDDEDLEEHPRVMQGLNQVKTEFLSVVWDLQSYAATHTREAITQARSLRELWHLRAAVFNVIATHRGQIEAYRRLESLNQHFPVRITTAVDATQGRVSHW